MIVANYWAEARRQHGLGRQKITVQRWGWSDTSEAEAQAMAEVRADEALAQAQRDAATPRRERKTAYNGAQGLPIREEVLQREGDAVITRNGYGAECLNTPNVLFADVDFEPRTSTQMRLAAAALLVAAVLLPALWLLGGMLAWVVGVGALLLLTLPLAALMQRGADAALGGPHVRALARLRAFIERHPAWAVRVYRTPAGLRLLATQGLVDPVGAEAQAFLPPWGRTLCMCACALISAAFARGSRASPGAWASISTCGPGPACGRCGPSSCACARNGCATTKSGRRNTRPATGSSRWAAAPCTWTCARWWSCTTA